MSPAETTSPQKYLENYTNTEYGKLVNYLKRFYGQDSEDACQDAIVQVIKYWHSLRSEDKFRPWMLKTAINRALTIKKKGKRIKTSYLPELLSEPSVPQIEQDETATRIRRAINSLPDKYKSVIVLRYYSDLSMLAISKELKIPEGSVKRRLHQAKKLLHAKLGNF